MTCWPLHTKYRSVLIFVTHRISKFIEINCRFVYIVVSIYLFFSVFFFTIVSIYFFFTQIFADYVKCVRDSYFSCSGNCRLFYFVFVLSHLFLILLFWISVVRQSHCENDRERTMMVFSLQRGLVWHCWTAFIHLTIATTATKYMYDFHKIAKIHFNISI